jgi:hypothetical protein
MKTIVILFLVFSISGTPQCLSTDIVFIDSVGKVMDSIDNNLDFILNNREDTLKLEQLYNPNLKDQIKNNPYGLVSRAEYCLNCLKKDIKIIETVDLNQDGTKEVIIFREWHCSASPPEFHPYGVGTETESSSQYEVWDIKSKKQLFKVKNWLSTSITVSTNVGYSDGYRFDVKVSKSGAIYLSNPTKENCGFEMGKYKYNSEKEEYIKE